MPSANTYMHLADVGIGFSAEPEVFEVHNIAKR